jgi:hypothetical protein
MGKNDVEQFTAKETQTRFEAALRGARTAGPKHNESLTPKRDRAQPRKKKKTERK